MGADELRHRRDALLRELTEISARLSEIAPPPERAAWGEAIAHTREFVVLMDAQQRILRTNRVYPGLPDPTGVSAFEFMPEGARQPLREAIAEAERTGLPQQVMVRAMGENGEVTVYSDWIVPLRTEAGVGHCALIAIDVTHTERVEQGLTDERDLLAALVSEAPDAIMVVDAERRIRFANRIGHGWQAEDVVGRRAEEFVPPSDQQRVIDAIEGVFATGEPARYRTRLAAPTGEFWFATRVGAIMRGGVVERASLVSTEITEQVRLEQARAEEREALRQSEERFRVLFQSSPEALVILDAEEGRFVEVNDPACALFGRTREDLLTRGPIELSAPMQKTQPLEESAAARVRAALAGTPQVFEWVHLRKDGSEVPCEVRLVGLPYTERRLVRGSIIDIGERKRNEAERQRLSAELAQSQKMQAIGQLTGGIAHDFNNLLTVVMANLELVNMDADDPNEVRTLAQQALEATRRARSLTERLLAFARRQPLRPCAVEVGKLVPDIEHILRRTLGESITITTTVSPGLWACEADPRQLENAILNLAINARDAMPAGGRLTIAARNAHLDSGFAEVDADAPGAAPYVMLGVADDGAGISSEVLDRVFEPFFTTKQGGQGTGLGLSMVYGFAKQSGGHVDIDSEPGMGTTVRIYLPRAHVHGSRPQVAAPQPESTDVAQGDGSLVLVVEDDNEVRRSVVQMLKRLGYRTLDVGDGSAAMQALSQAQPALLLSDIVLPGGKNGVEVARRATEKQPGLKVLFMSGYSEDALIHNGRLDPDVSLIEKPFTREELARAVRDALHGASTSATPTS